MDDKTFFSYYIPALKKALEEDHINYGFMIKGPDWWYPENINNELEEFEDSHYDEFPLLENVAYYFDAKSHGFSEIFYITIDEYRNKIIEEMILIANKFGIDG